MLKGLIFFIIFLGFFTIATAATSDDQSAEGQQARPGGRNRVCMADVKKYCHDVKPGEGKIVACLKENVSKLSPACAARLSKAASKQDQGQDEDSAEK